MEVFVTIFKTGYDYEGELVMDDNINVFSTLDQAREHLKNYFYEKVKPEMEENLSSEFFHEIDAELSDDKYYARINSCHYDGYILRKTIK